MKKEQNTLSEKDKRFIRNNHRKITNGEIARRLGIPRATVDAFCSRNGLSGKGIVWGDAIKNNSFRARIIKRFMSEEDYRKFWNNYLKNRKDTSKGQPKKELSATERNMAEAIVSCKKRYKDFQNSKYTLGKLQRIVKSYREEITVKK